MRKSTRSSSARRSPKPPKVTLKDIAKRADLSISAISLALRNHPSISNDTKRRVAKISKEMGYRSGPKLSAAGLSRMPVNLAYCLVGESLQDEAYVPIAHGIIRACREWKAHLAIQEIPADRLPEKPITMAAGDSPSGYLLMGFVTDELVDYFARDNKPVLVMGSSPITRPVPIVDVDTLGAGMRVAQEALHQGYKNFACITANMTSRHNLEFLRGVRAALAPHGLSITDEQIVVALDFEIHDQKHLQQIDALTQTPTAIVTAGVVTANACASIFHTKGWMQEKQLTIYTLRPSAVPRVNPLYRSLNMGLERIGEISVDRIVQIILGYSTCDAPYRILLSTLDWLNAGAEDAAPARSVG